MGKILTPAGVRMDWKSRKARDQEIRPSTHLGWNGLEIPGRPEPLLPPGRHVRNIPFQDGMYQPAQTFVSGGGAGGDWTSDGIAPMAFSRVGHHNNCQMA